MSKKFFAKRPFFDRRERLFIRPTKAGFTLFFFILAVLLMSAIYTNMGLQLFGFFLLGLYGLAMTWTHSELRGLKVRSLKVVDGPRGYRTLLEMELQSNLALDRWGIEFRGYFRNLRTGEKWKCEQKISQVEGTGLLRKVYSIELQPTRGEWQSERVLLHSRAPFGLFVVWFRIRLNAPLKFWIYPQVLTYDPPRSRPSVEKIQTRSRGEETFSHLAEARELENAFRLAPKPHTDESVFYVKTFEAEVGADCLIDWNQMSGDLETKLSQCTGALFEREGLFEIRTPYFQGFIENKMQKRKAFEAWAAAPEAGT